ncbi:MAG: GTP cyclohydrolase II, partial [Epsilonproteobacteria bacterium]|nr:GTP cyclohydrolase II [Campylobacterota bacterium]
LKDIKLITNNPDKIAYVNSLGINIVSRVPAVTPINVYNDGYINTKKEYMGHML